MKSLLTSHVRPGSFICSFTALPAILLFLASTAITSAQDGRQVVLVPEMVTIVTEGALPLDGMIDEQQTGENTGMFGAQTAWEEPPNSSQLHPLEYVIDLGAEKHIANILFFASNGHGDIAISAGEPGNWTEILRENGKGFNVWRPHTDLDARTRYLRFVKETVSGVFREMLVFEYTEEEAQALAVRKEQASRDEAMIAGATTQAADRPLVETSGIFGKLPLVDEILVGEAPKEGFFVEEPEGVSSVEEILGRPTRVLPDKREKPSFFAYRVAKGHLLEAGKAYLLEVDFPEEAPRSFHIANRGADITRGIQTGNALGDTIFTYTQNNLESLNIPLSQKHETMQQLFWLNDNIADVELPRAEGKRSFSPVGGFLVIVGQPESQQTPISRGGAITRIRLFEVPEPEKFNVELRMPPAPLPQRHLFFREEMSDGTVVSRTPEERAVTSVADWYRNKCRIMNFMGMNTFSKDLLEFGNAQHWDVEYAGWYVPHRFPDMWGKIVDLATEHKLNIFPYYEYAGSTGPQGLARPMAEEIVSLGGNQEFTHITWAERFQVDITDPAVLVDFKRVLELTVVKFKDRGNFVGAWLRPRVSQLPISFGDKTLERFAADRQLAEPPERKALQENAALLEDYYAWWFDKRMEFLVAVRDYLREEKVAGNPLVLFQTTHSEPAPRLPVKGGNRVPLVTDTKSTWEEVALSEEAYENLAPLGLTEEFGIEGLYARAVLEPTWTWGNWEWHHASPQSTPDKTKDLEGILFAYPFNRAYTVHSPELIERFRGPSGLAMIRHFPLNENVMDDITGYFVTDVERTGPYIVLPEALAVANGDPWFIGYTSGHNFNRAFPGPVRKFNANFLALPALPSVRNEKASSDQEVVVREIDGGEHGKWLAIVNTGLEAKKQVRITLPGNGTVTEAATGDTVSASNGVVTLDLEPAELRSLRIQ